MISFSEKDLSQLARHGISKKEALRQAALLAAPPSPVVLERPCGLGNGIQSLTKGDRERYEALHRKAAQGGRFGQFVPASGAATRLFQPLREFLEAGPAAREAALKGPAGSSLRTFLDNLGRFPFFEDLRKALARGRLTPQGLLKKGDHETLLKTILDAPGLGYAGMPKGLLPCHRHGKGARTPFEEHLADAAGCVRDGEGVCRLHFTVSEEHRDQFQKVFHKVRPAYERELKARFRVEFSVQKKATDTLALGPDGRLSRHQDGRLRLRPGGHGALLENLGAWKGDLVFIRNIDNVAPERLRGDALSWRRALAGLLVELQEEVFRCLGWLTDHPEDERAAADALRFLSRRLAIAVPERLQNGSPAARRRFLLDRLNRPLRVCGMVRNEGEPGGGPFWVREKGGGISLQIVERSQVSEAQRDLFEEATHFNPVDMVCGLRDRDGRPFDLKRFADPEAVFISRKSEEGHELLALEHPGLWNGGMAGWNTVLVEIPSQMFQPIKTINDLLRPGHQDL